MSKSASRSFQALALLFIIIVGGTLLIQVMIPTPIESLYTHNLGPQSASAILDDSGRYHLIYQNRPNPFPSLEIYLMYQYYENGAWSETTLVFSTENQTGPAQREIGPSQIACDNNGNVAVGWLDEDWYDYDYFNSPEWHSDDFTDIWYANEGMIWYSIFNGTAWSDPTYFSFNPVRCDYRFLYLQNGSLFVIWVESDGEYYDSNLDWNLYCRPLGHSAPSSVLANSTNDDTVLLDFQLLEGDEGQLYALWSYNYSLYYRIFEDSSWSDTTCFSFGNEHLHNFKATIDSAGIIHVASHIYGNATGDYGDYIAYQSLFEDSLSPITVISDDVDSDPHLRFDGDPQGNLHVMWEEHYRNGWRMYSCRRIDSVWQTPIIIPPFTSGVTGLAMMNASVSYALDVEFLGRIKILKHYQIGSDWAAALSIIASGFPDIVAQVHFHIYWESLLLFVRASLSLPLVILLLRRKIEMLLSD